LDKLIKIGKSMKMVVVKSPDILNGDTVSTMNALLL